MNIWRRITFFTVVFLVLFGLQYLVYRTFRNFIREKAGENSRWKFAAIIPFIIFNLPYIYIIANGFSSANIPPAVMKYVFSPFYIFQGAVVFIGLYLFIGKLIKAPFAVPLWIMNKFDSFRKWYSGFTRREPVKKFDSSRRAFVRTSAALVSGYAFVGATAGVVGGDDFELTELSISIKDLPQELNGTTLTLISDIHSGPYMKEGLMQKYVDAVNEIGSDLIVMPGDLTNTSVKEAYEFSRAFSRLEAKYGAYASLGNHDFFSDPGEVTKVITGEPPLRILRNEHDVINKNSKQLVIMGSDDTRQSGGGPDPMLMQNFEKTLASARTGLGKSGRDFDSLPKLLLFHKPYFFDEMSEKNVDLILSGHTHGGQVVLAKFGGVNLSFAGAVSKYISGLYRSNGSSMYVSRGIGNVALPIRFNCSPEITKITLTS